MAEVTRIRQPSVASMPPVRSLEAAQRLVTNIEAVSYALLRRRILSIIAVCSIV